MELDHGILNIPLAKRGNIDNQIDAWKREQVAKTKAANAVYLEQRAAAKALLAAKDAEFFERMAKRLGLTVKQAAKELNSMAYFTPSKILVLAA